MSNPLAEELSRQLSLTDALWSALIGMGVREGVQLPLGVVFSASNQEVARALTTYLEHESDLQFSMHGPDDEGSYIVDGTTFPLTLSRDRLRDLAEWMVTAAHENGCRFDGFQVALPQKSFLRRSMIWSAVVSALLSGGLSLSKGTPIAMLSAVLGAIGGAAGGWLLVKGVRPTTGAIAFGLVGAAACGIVGGLQGGFEGIALGAFVGLVIGTFCGLLFGSVWRFAAWGSGALLRGRPRRCGGIEVRSPSLYARSNRDGHQQ